MSEAYRIYVGDLKKVLDSEYRATTKVLSIERTVQGRVIAAISSDGENRRRVIFHIDSVEARGLVTCDLTWTEAPGFLQNGNVEATVTNCSNKSANFWNLKFDLPVFPR